MTAKRSRTAARLVQRADLALLTPDERAQLASIARQLGDVDEARAVESYPASVVSIRTARQGIHSAELQEILP